MRATPTTALLLAALVAGCARGAPEPASEVDAGLHGSLESANAVEPGSTLAQGADPGSESSPSALGGEAAEVGPGQLEELEPQAAPTPDPGSGPESGVGEVAVPGSDAFAGPADAALATALPAPVQADVEVLQGWKVRIAKQFATVRAISAEALEAELQLADVGGTRPLLIDVRAASEFAVSRIRGARRAETLEQALALLEGQPRDRRVVAYCSIGYRSAELVEQLNAAGFENAVNLEGSIFEWGNSGRAVHRGDERVDVIHPFDAEWGRLLDRRLWADEDTW
jgi:rhodanese-related sulfurtransferase